MLNNHEAPISQRTHHSLPWLRPLVSMPLPLRYFTIVLLITGMVITGVLTFKTGMYFAERYAHENRSFHDQVISTLRYAQKIAIAQNRFVCVAFGANSITLTQGKSASCGGILANPNGQASYSITSSHASFVSPQPRTFSFDER